MGIDIGGPVRDSDSSTRAADSVSAEAYFVARCLSKIVDGPEAELVEGQIEDLLINSPHKTPEAASLDDCLGTNRACLLCITPRSGSTYLSTLMDSTWQLGSCLEFMNFEDIQLRAENHSFGSLTDYLKYAIGQSARSGGIFSMKGDLYHYVPLLRRGLLRKGLQQATFVYLTREDVLAQAVSAFRAIQTGQWSSLQARRREPRFDAEGILHQLDVLLRMMSRWELVFAMLDVQPIRLTYEQVVAQPSASVRRLAQVLGVSIASTVDSPLKKQRDEVSAEWVERLRKTAGLLLDNPKSITRSKKSWWRRRAKLYSWWARNCTPSPWRRPGHITS